MSEKKLGEMMSTSNDDEKFVFNERMPDSELSLNNADAFGDSLSRKISQDDKIPEFEDIYDCIYGNVKTKRVFYENKNSPGEEPQLRRASSRINQTKENVSKSTIFESPPSSEADDNSSEAVVGSSPECDADCSSSPPSEQGSLITLPPLPLEIPFITNTFQCPKCENPNFVHDRADVLDEINANLKIELESTKHHLKEEISKNIHLNFEIANIESILETYYKESKSPKSTFSALYSAVKTYIGDDRSSEGSRETYTYKRIKAIANYVESLKAKFAHQDRIIKNNFVENPYYSDLMMRHESTIRQLDEISTINQTLMESLKKKEAEELEVIGELNRQKFVLENRCRDLEAFYKEKLSAADEESKQVREEYVKKLWKLEESLKRKDDDAKRLKIAFEARCSNYDQELAILYGKWNKTKVESQKHLRQESLDEEM